MKHELELRTADGVMPAAMFEPAGRGGDAGGVRPGVILYMDAFGPRPALEDMALRLASEGYRVLLPDLFYRFGDYGAFDAATAFSDPPVRDRLRAMIAATTQEMTASDSAAMIAALEAAGAGARIGAVGYCMGGGRALTAAAAYPGRIAAAASFHGGNLAGDAPDSPHRRAADIRARIYVGTAGVDRSFPPEQSARLAQALREAEVDHIIENYPGMAHGWCVSDHSVYDAAGAERHWRRLLELFSDTLF